MAKGKVGWGSTSWYNPPRASPTAAPSAPAYDPSVELMRAEQERNRIENERRVAAANARRVTLSSDADVDMQQTAQETGFQYNPASGQFGGFDPTNPFSQAALLLKTRNESTQVSEMGYQRQTRRTEQDYAQAGQLYSGSYQSGKAEDDRVIGETRKKIGFDYDKGYDTLKRGFDDYVKRYLRRKRDINTLDPEDVLSM